MSHTICLLGRPSITGPDGAYQFRSRKSWAVLAYLLRTERPPTRSELAGLLFASADDPLRALRWSLAEIRRGLAGAGEVDGDPVVLTLAPGTVVDVDVLTRATWPDAVRLPGLGAELLDGLAGGGAGFESWLHSERRHAAAATEAILHEAALGSLSSGDLDSAIRYAVRVVTMSPLDENHHALLIRLYRLAGDDRAAARQLATCTDLLREELGTAPGAAVRAAARESRIHLDGPADAAAIEALIESGTAAVSAGATETGVDSLRTAARLADRADLPVQRVAARLVLAEALVHSLRGLDEEGMATLLAADRIALQLGDRAAVARARAELGYVDFLRARYDRAEVWLTDARRYAEQEPRTTARATTYLGAVASDRADYPRALDLLEQAASLSRAAGDGRGEAYALSMLGRAYLLRGDLDAAAGRLAASADLAQRDHWLAFLPWPQALQGHVELAGGELGSAATLLDQSFARACRLGDPCWEGLATRGRALLAEATGDTAQAFELLADARTRCNRVADPYVWLDVHILDALCALGRRHGHPDTGRWVAAMQDGAARTGMRELTVRALLHGAATGHDGDAAAAALLAADVDNPALAALLPV
jgi:DNA-binding SARP family transcriptional activator